MSNIIVPSFNPVINNRGRVEKITTRPEIIMVTGNSVLIEAQVSTFKVTAVGGLLSYQWQITQTAGSSDWIDIPGATGSRYDYTADPADDGKYLRVVVSNQVGSSNSYAKVLDITGTIVVSSLTPEEIQFSLYGYAAAESTVSGVAGTLVPDAVNGADVAGVFTDSSLLWVEIVGSLAQDFFDSIETTQFGTLNTASAVIFNIDPGPITQWAWSVGAHFNNIGVARDVTFDY